MTKWQKIFTDELLYRAEIVKAVLDDHQIESIIISKKDTSYHFGAHELLVLPDDVLQAIRIIKEKINFE